MANSGFGDTEPQKSDKIGRRGMLECMAWSGAGLVWTMNGGVASSALAGEAPSASGLFTFVQISDSHIGFKKLANPDPVATLRETVAKIRSLPVKPEFVLHTGDITHLATPEQFDLAQSVLGELGIPVKYVPGEHDMAGGTDPRPYQDRFGVGTLGEGWYSFDAGGVHFIGLNSVLHLADKGLGSLGDDQLVWLKKDLARTATSTPIVLFSHFPLWALYPDWGWGTADGAVALGLLRRFGSVTVLNGHIHQIQQKIEGNVTFHTARSTAYPQPAPGEGAGPGPLVVPTELLRSFVGLTSVTRRGGRADLALIDATVAGV